MTVEQTIEQFKLALNSNAYLNMCETSDMQNAISALEKLIPKKPIGRDLFELGTATGHTCPTCGYDFPIGNYKPYKHRPECGQRIDRGDA